MIAFEIIRADFDELTVPHGSGRSGSGVKSARTATIKGKFAVLHRAAHLRLVRDVEALWSGVL
jgi:hypothetical protein